MARIETGIVKFDGDWAGVFLRGDHAMMYSIILQKITERSDLNFDHLERATLQNLQELLASCHEPLAESPQHLRSFDQCRNGD